MTSFEDHPSFAYYNTVRTKSTIRLIILQIMMGWIYFSYNKTQTNLEDFKCLLRQTQKQKYKTCSMTSHTHTQTNSLIFPHSTVVTICVGDRRKSQKRLEYNLAASSDQAVCCPFKAYPLSSVVSEFSQRNKNVWILLL